MIRTVIVADSGDAMAALTQALWGLPGVDIARHANGRASVSAVIGAVAPELVVIDGMSWLGNALNRVGEVRETAPHAVVVLLAERIERTAHVQALRAGASSVLLRSLDEAALRHALAEALHPSPIAA
jgi:DNA-binding NarL/FixJ family response regulator